jgi:chromosome segregation ATPase
MAQRTETDLRELTDLIKGLGTKIEDLDRKMECGFVEVDKKIEALDKKMDLGFVEADKKIEALDKKMERGFVEVDKKIEALDNKMDLGFQELDSKMDLGFQELDSKMDLGFQQLDGKIDKLDIRLGILNTTVTNLDTRLWAFGGIALSVTLGSLLTVFARYIFTDSPKF